MADNINFELTKPVAVSKGSETDITPEIQDLEKIMQVEISAVEAYKQVINKYSTYEHEHELRSILADHENAVEFWKTQLRSKAAPIEESSDPWNVVVDTFSASDKLHADSATLQALKDGEEHGLNAYEDLLHDNKVNFQSHSYIKNICLDQQRKHIAVLDGLIDQP